MKERIKGAFTKRKILHFLKMALFMELKGLIREALIKMILGFDIALEIEEE